jgi:hypothetical protein
MSSFGRIGRTPSEYLQEMLTATDTFPRVALVLIQPGTARLLLLWGSDPQAADHLAALLAGAAHPIAVAGFGADERIHLEPVEEYREPGADAWIGRFLVLLGERLRAQLERTGSQS